MGKLLTPLLNGQLYGWARIEFSIGGNQIIGIDALDYDDKQEKTNEYGAGQYAVGRGSGHIEYTGKITLHMEEVEALQAASPTGRLQDLGLFTIIVVFDEANKVVTHTLSGCEFTENGRKLKKGDKVIACDCPMAIGHIKWK